VVWSSPAAGSVDVPVDADLLILTESIDLATAELSIVGDGLIEMPLEPGSALPGHYALPELEPNQAHTIAIRPAFESALITFEFTTGERRHSPSEGALSLESVSVDYYERGVVEPGLCTDVLFRDSCFDTGVPPLQTFEVDFGLEPPGEHSLWAIETVYGAEAAALPEAARVRLTPWPAACGAPRQWGSADAEYRVYKINENGVIRASNTLAHAFEPLPPVTSIHPRAGVGERPSHILCSASVGPARSSGTLVAALALGSAVLWRRRRAPRLDGLEGAASSTPRVGGSRTRVRGPELEHGQVKPVSSVAARGARLS
jgi:MYXO-CTERM domain-containing protein